MPAASSADVENDFWCEAQRKNNSRNVREVTDRKLAVVFFCVLGDKLDFDLPDNCTNMCDRIFVLKRNEQYSETMRGGRQKAIRNLRLKKPMPVLSSRFVCYNFYW